MHPDDHEPEWVLMWSELWAHGSFNHYQCKHCPATMIREGGR